MKNPKLKILVLSGGRGGERAVSLKSGRMVARVLDKKLFHIIEAELTRRLDFIFTPQNKRFNFLDGLKELKSLWIDCVFPALHGEFGEDGQLQTILEILEIPFVGSGSIASRVAMDKSISHALFVAGGIRTPRTRVIKTLDDLQCLKSFLKQGQRFVVKPINGGSSVGIMITDRKDKIEKRLRADLQNGRTAILQEYLAGREFTCGIIEKTAKEVMPLIPTEIRPKNATFFDYHEKYAKQGSEEITPPDLPKSKIVELQKLALCVHQILGCRGISRSDFILVKNQFYILETNTLPGMTEKSLIPQGAAALGISFKDLLTILVRRALV